MSVSGVTDRHPSRFKLIPALGFRGSSNLWLGMGAPSNVAGCSGARKRSESFVRKGAVMNRIDR